MSRIVTVGAAQLGPIQRADSRAAVVARMLDLLRQAGEHRCDLVVFPELALTTFFPRWWMEDQDEIDCFFEREMPSNETAPLFNEAQASGHRLLSRLRRARAGERRDAPLQHLDPRRRLRPRGRQVPQDPPARPCRARALARLPAPGEALFRGRRSRLAGLARHGRASTACASATTGAGPRPIA